MPPSILDQRVTRCETLVGLLRWRRGWAHRGRRRCPDLRVPGVVVTRRRVGGRRRRRRPIRRHDVSVGRCRRAARGSRGRTERYRTDDGLALEIKVTITLYVYPVLAIQWSELLACCSSSMGSNPASASLSKKARVV